MFRLGVFLLTFLLLVSMATSEYSRGRIMARASECVNECVESGHNTFHCERHCSNT
uniref:Conotoxin Cal14.14 n=1 Tax=Californiconus californicus TaxID=1736779 RepID=CUEE_CONCL|nr:RecName: Full=Conotoxin Cal14.14; AltName: Full=O3_cal14d; Flags: Precursor [Californiconus californicus]